MLVETRQIETLVQMYVSAHARSNLLVSTREAVRAIRLGIPDCGLSDGELVEKIAHHALLHQCAIVFDCGKRDKEAQRFADGCGLRRG